MAKRKKNSDAKGQQSSDAAGTPAYMQGKGDTGITAEASTQAGQDPRSLIEQKNNALAQELLKKQQKRIKGY